MQSLYGMARGVLVKQLSGEKRKLWFIAFLDFHSVNTLIMADFKLWAWSHWLWIWEEMYIIGLHKPVRADSSTLLNNIVHILEIQKVSVKDAHDLTLSEKASVYINIYCTHAILNTIMDINTHRYLCVILLLFPRYIYVRMCVRGVWRGERARHQFVRYWGHESHTNEVLFTTM